MKASELISLINGISTGYNLKPAIQGEVASYAELLKKKGSSIPLIFDEDAEVIIDNSAIQTLLSETLSGRLSNVDLAYICDCLTLGEKVNFPNEKVQDIIFEIADPEINGGFKSDTELEHLIELSKQHS
jgi:hypothetical protein